MTSKFHNKRVFYDGYYFDSASERDRYKELSHQETIGEISDLVIHPRFELIPAQYAEPTRGKRGGIKRGKCLERAVEYTADFAYTKDGEYVVEDVKSKYTRKEKDWILRRKMMLYLMNIRVREVIR